MIVNFQIFSAKEVNDRLGKIRETLVDVSQIGRNEQMR